MSTNRSKLIRGSDLKHERLSALDELKKLKEQKKSGLDSYKINYGDIYDEVDEDSYVRHVQKKAKEEDDFVVDDDGQGYAETGLEIWDQPPEFYDDTEDADDYYNDMDESNYNDVQSKRKKTDKGLKSRGTLGSFFSNTSYTNINKETKPISSTNIDACFEALMNEFEEAPIKDTSSFPYKNEISEEFCESVPHDENINEIDNSHYLSREESSSEVALTKVDTTTTAKETIARNPIFLPEISKKSTLPVKSIGSFSGKVNKSEFMKNILLPTTVPPASEKPHVMIGEDEKSKQEAPGEPLVTHVNLNDKSFFESDQSTCYFYWLDGLERANGQVILFGKIYYKSTGSFVTASLTVKGIERNLFFLPRPTINDEGNEVVTIEKVYQEIANVLTKHSISRFKCKKVTRKYAFELADIPSEAEYMKVAYDYSFPQLSDGALNGATYSHVFGINRPALESVLLKRRIMGPCWLELKNVQAIKRNLSWCKLELEISSPKELSVLHEDIARSLKIPKLSVASLLVKTYFNKKTQMNEIVSMTMQLYPSTSMESLGGVDTLKPSLSIHAIRPIEESPFQHKLSEILEKQGCKNVLLCPTEKALLNYILAQLQRLDPDVLAGHSIMGHDLPILLYRLRHLKVERWSRLGRLHWTSWPKGSTRSGLGFGEKQVLAGRLVCDTYISCKDIVKSKNYSLKELAQEHLNMTLLDLDYERMEEWLSSSDGLVYLLRHSEMAAHLCYRLLQTLLLLPLTKQLTNLAGNLWAHTLFGSRAERNDCLLLHEFYTAKYITPDKLASLKDDNAISFEADDDGEDSHQNSSSRKRRPAYSGGLVLEPKTGLYETYVLLLDFNSLYPSIIQEFNLCFTTVERTNEAKNTKSSSEENNNLSESVESNLDLPALPEKSVPFGVLPRLLGQLVERRRQVKKLFSQATSDEEKTSLDIRQKALKLTANSMYGCLGFPHSRFYAKPLAMLITHQGRTLLQDTVRLVEHHFPNLQVIYGDTDSLMIHTGTLDFKEARQYANTLKKAINEQYKILEIELDAMFRKLLLLKKKKYAALVLNDISKMHESSMTSYSENSEMPCTLETKGLDLVRRDWCELSNQVSRYILQRLFSFDAQDNIVDSMLTYLQSLSSALTSETIHTSHPLSSFIIYKSLTKAPESYADGQPHVAVALRLKQKGIYVKAGDTIPYIICYKSESLNPADSAPMKRETALALRAYHPDEVMKDNQLHVDIPWYLSQQIFPPMRRLCAVVPFIPLDQLALNLGLNPSSYSSVSTNDRHEPTFMTKSLLDIGSNFDPFLPFSLTCSQCRLVYNPKLSIEKLNKSIVESVYESKTPWQCPGCQNEPSKGQLYHSVVSLCRKAISLYYQSWQHCDDSNCPIAISDTVNVSSSNNSSTDTITVGGTRKMAVYEKRCPNAPQCRGSLIPYISERALYLQLVYYRTLFTEEKTDANTVSFRAHDEVYRMLKNVVDSFLNKSAFPIVSLTQLFST